MSYIQLTYEERVTLSALCQQGFSVRAIARILKRHPSTLYRELDRNRCHVTMVLTDHLKHKGVHGRGANDHGEIGTTPGWISC